MSLVFPNPLIVLILAMTLPLACPSASAQNSPVAEPAPEGRSGELPDHTRKKLTAEEKESRAREKQSYLDEIATRGEQAQPLFVNALQDMQMPPEEGVPIFIALLSAKSQAVQDRAMFVLATEFKKDAVPAVPMILEFLRSPSLRSSMRDLALKTLAEIGPGAHEAVPLLTQFLAAAQKNSLTDRTNLIVALGRMGTAGASSLQTLRSYLKDPQVAVQYAAFEAIGTLQDPEPIT